MFIDLDALRSCAAEGAIAVKLCIKTTTPPDYSLGIEGSTSYVCTAVDGYVYVEKVSELAIAQGTTNREAWYVCLFPPFPEVSQDSRFEIEGRHYQIEKVFPSRNQGEDVLMRYHCLKV